jgi:hypothetical protein
MRWLRPSIMDASLRHRLMLAILGRVKVMIIKKLAALAVLALTLSSCAPLPIGKAAGGATALVVTDPHWCREHRYYRYDLEWHLHHCGGWCTVSRLWSLIATVQKTSLLR